MLLMDFIAEIRKRHFIRLYVNRSDKIKLTGF